MLAAVAFSDAHDQLLSDVTREVEVDVGNGDHLVVDEAAERQAGRDGIDVRETRQVADDRADAGAASSSRRQRHGADYPARAPRARTRGQARALPSGAGRTPRAPTAQSMQAHRRVVAARVSCGRSHPHIARRMLGRRSLRAAGLRGLLRRRSRDSDSRAPVSGRTCSDRRARVCGGLHLRAAVRASLGREQHRFVVPAPLAFAAVE